MPIISKIKITGDQTTHLTGEAPAGTTLQAMDLDYAVSNRLGFDDGFTPVGSVGANGKFSIPVGQLVGGAEGDYVRLRAVDAQGNVKGLVTIRLDAAGVEDTTNAPFVGRRLAIYDDGTGNNAVIAANDQNRPVSSPFATVKITNPRTGESKTVQLDADGLFPADTKIKAKMGDRLTFAVSDGVRNTDFASVDTGVWTVVGKEQHANDLADPTPLAGALDAQGRSKLGTKQFKGPVVSDGISSGDVGQQFIGDCYLPAAVATVAKFNPDALAKMFKQRADGNWDVTFNVLNRVTGKFEKRAVPVDTDLYVDSSGQPVYGAGLPLPHPAGDTMELWWPLLEKAYAKLKRGYERIGNGGEPSAVFEALLGKKSVSLGIDGADSLWTRIVKATDKKLPQSVCTSDDAARYEGTGIHEDHCYSILGYKTEAGQRLVQLRNPWGYSEPGDDGTDDGVFWLPVEQCANLFDTFYSVR